MRPTKLAHEMSVAELAAYIDHSILKPDFTTDDVRREVEAAIGFGCKTVCVNPASIEIAILIWATFDSVLEHPNGKSTTTHTPVSVPAHSGAVRGHPGARHRRELRLDSQR